MTGKRTAGASSHRTLTHRQKFRLWVAAVRAALSLSL